MATGSHRDSPARRVLLAGGGSAGHVFPALAVVRSLEHRVRDLEFQWLGSDRIESTIVPAAGIPFQRFDIRFAYRALSIQNLNYYRQHILPILFGRPFLQARSMLDAYQPGLLLATGGYVSAPVIWAALDRNVPVALITLDDPPGAVNWHFAPQAWRVFTASPQIAEGFLGRCAQAKLRVCGYPAMPVSRNRVRVLRELGIDPERRVIVAMGGSLGATPVHRAVVSFLKRAADSPDPQWNKLALLHVAGERMQLMQSAVDSSQLPERPVQYRQVGFLEDSASVMAAADFYIGRSGAATVGELLQAGIPAFLIPDTQHRDRQQFGNAHQLQLTGQGHVSANANPDGREIMHWLERVWDAPRREAPEPAPASLIAEELTSLWQ
ncbi:MAG: UDP-N-acetylglucosamine--N-acetylmuramyl-(pentapeptide) pyrophosphoryl-undecaprenol N-acetylglucosamine transferase [bacterium]